MKTITRSPEGPQVPKLATIDTPVPHNATSTPTFKRKSKAVKISDEVISYYNNLLNEHNAFIQQNSRVTYRIL